MFNWNYVYSDKKERIEMVEDSDGKILKEGDKITVLRNVGKGFEPFKDFEVAYGEYEADDGGWDVGTIFQGFGYHLINPNEIQVNYKSHLYQQSFSSFRDKSYKIVKAQEK